MKKTYGVIHQPEWLKFSLLAVFVVLIGSSTAAYGQDVSTSFEFFDTSGSFKLGTSPKSVTFTNGLAQTVGQTPLYHSGSFSFMVTQGNTATITFETPAASVTLWLRDQSSTSVLTVFDPLTRGSRTGRMFPHPLSSLILVDRLSWERPPRV